MGQPGVHFKCHLEVPVALQSTTDDGQMFRVAGDVAHGHAGHTWGAHLGDPAAVQQCDGTAGLGVVHDHHAVDVGQALGVIVLIAGHPLQADLVRTTEVGRHRVDERRVAAGGDLGLRRVLHQSAGLLLERVLEDVDDLGPGQAESFEVSTVKDQHLVIAHAKYRSGL